LPQLTRLAGALPASPCTLGWNQSPPGSVAGYVLYYGIVGGTTNRQVVGMVNTTTLFNLLASSNYFFYLTAYDANGVESPPSSTVYYQPQALSRLTLTSPVQGTMNLQFRAAPASVCLIQYTPTLSPAQWQNLETATADSNGNIVITDPTAGSSPSRFYRAMLYSNPQVLSSVTLASVVSGTVTLQFHATPGAVCRVQYTPSLNPPRWQTLGSATADGSGNVTMTDQPPAGVRSRFYRAATP
ncbi:MAG TPA: fibronectin type III domain-containing protein, partial [Verrucomicrobiae bacterium]|nr:fibronectin type III domain-containing protein [Verrucomicrobiae bacterium]